MARKALNQTKPWRPCNRAISAKGERQRQRILDWLVYGYNNREIAEKLGLSKSGTAYHVRKLLEHFDAVNRTELAVRYATQKGDAN